MKALIQRVSEASVTVAGRVVSRIDRGVLLFVAIEQGDGKGQAEQLMRKVAGLRIFPDEQGRMNLSVQQVGGQILAVSQFTLAADLRKGHRPSFGPAEKPEKAEPLFDHCCRFLEGEGLMVSRGVFGAEMAVGLVNDGPVTFWLASAPS